MNVDKYETKLERPHSIGLNKCKCEKCEYCFEYIKKYEAFVAAKKAWLQDCVRLEELFKHDALVQVRLADHPKREKAYAMAWEEGHSYGLYEVYLNLEKLAELLLSDQAFILHTIYDVKKRLRKKKRLGEFKELCFFFSADFFDAPLSITRREFVIDQIIAYAEAHGIGVAIGGDERGIRDGIAGKLGRGSLSDTDRHMFEDHLRGVGMTNIQVGELTDRWWGFKSDHVRDG